MLLGLDRGHMIKICVFWLLFGVQPYAMDETSALPIMEGCIKYPAAMDLLFRQAVKDWYWLR